MFADGAAEESNAARPFHSKNNMKKKYTYLLIGILTLATSVLSAKKPNVLFRAVCFNPF